MVLAIGLYVRPAACIFMLIFGMWNHLGEAGPFIANTYFLGVYLVFGFFQAIGGPVGTAIMGNWMVTPEARRNRGLIYGTWTTHQYLGNIIAPVIIVLCNISHAKWWWGLMWPVFINAGWGLVCHFALPATPKRMRAKEAAEKACVNWLYSQYSTGGARQARHHDQGGPADPVGGGLLRRVRLHEDDQLRLVLLVLTQREK